MTITTSDMGGADRRERTLEQHRENIRQALSSIGESEVLELVLFRALLHTEGDRTSAVDFVKRDLDRISKDFLK